MLVTGLWTVIAAWLNAFQRNPVGVGMNWSASRGSLNHVECICSV